MCDVLDAAAMRNLGSSEHCPLCKKTFDKESTRKRHYYYCRSKQHDTNASRRRSCVACIRAKTRCKWLASTGLQTCIRCNERGTKCEYAIDSRPSRVSGHDHRHSTSSPPSWSAPDTGIQSSTISSILAETPDINEDLQVGTYPQKYPSLPTTLDTLLDSWDVNFNNVAALDLENSLIGNQDISSAPTTQLTDTLVTGISSLQSDNFQLSSLNPFVFRTLTKQSHVPLASLATKILRSYPFMMLQNGTCPPFLSPQMYAWARKGEGIRQQSLLNCVSLVQIFKLRTEENKNHIWGMIRSEQQRILAEHLSFDQWELLGALQALLFYCLLRLHDDPAGQDDFDSSLLNTVNAVSSTLSLLVQCDCSLPSEPNLAWRDWLFNESRRRTALVFRAINMLVDISTAITCYPMTGFGLIPLPCKTALWSPRDVDKWKAAFELYCKERTLYSLSEAGALTKLYADDAGIHQCVVEWDEWSAEVGEIGTLVMIMGELLN